MGTGLVLAGFQGYHVVERSHLHSCQNSYRQHWMKISRVTNQRLLARVITKVGRIPMVGRIRVRDGNGMLCKQALRPAPSTEYLHHSADRREKEKMLPDCVHYEHLPLINP